MEWLALPFGLGVLTSVVIFGTFVVAQMSKYTDVECFEFGRVVS
jgi:hypothetical protein